MDESITVLEETDIESLKCEWRNIYALLSNKYITQSFEWNAAYWLWKKRIGRTLLIKCNGVNGSNAYFPFFISDISNNCNDSTCKVETFGMLEPFLLHPQSNCSIDKVIMALANYLKKDLSIKLKSINPISRIYQQTTFLSKNKYDVTYIPQNDNSLLTLIDCGDNYWQSLPHRLHRSIKNGTTFLKNLGNLSCIIASYPHEIEAVFEDVCQIERNSWKALEHSDMISRHRQDLFYKDFMMRMSKECMACIAVLYIDYKPIAHLLISLNCEIAYLMKWSYHKDFKKAFPGIVLMENVMRYLLQMPNIKHIDFFGSHSTYKALWGAKPKPRIDVIICKK